MDLSKLTPAEREVFNLLVTGVTNRQIGAARQCSEKTIKTHVTAIFKSTGCKSRADLIAKHYGAVHHASP